jgi:2-oxoisovalerate dehydrogenase E1 component
MLTLDSLQPSTAPPIASSTATLARDALFDLDATIERVTMPYVPSPHSPLLLDAVVPSVARIVHAIRTIASI